MAVADSGRRAKGGKKIGVRGDCPLDGGNCLKCADPLSASSLLLEQDNGPKNLVPRWNWLVHRGMLLCRTVTSVVTQNVSHRLS